MSKPDTIVVDMVGYKDFLFILTTGPLYSIDLSRSGEFELVEVKNVKDCSQISIDKSLKLLFLFSEERGLISLDIKDPSHPEYIRDLMPSTLKEKEMYFVTNMDTHYKKSFLSVRNLGVLRIDYKRNSLDEIDIGREIRKVFLREPQDVKFNPQNNLLYVVDYYDGLVVLNILNGEIMLNRTLPNDDHPRNLILDGENAIIQGKKELHYFDLKKRRYHNIFDFKIGHLIRYYNYIIFTQKNTVNLLRVGTSISRMKREGLEEYPYFNKVYFWDKIRKLKDQALSEHSSS
jgi:hypothetical protein